MSSQENKLKKCKDILKNKRNFSIKKIKKI